MNGAPIRRIVRDCAAWALFPFALCMFAAIVLAERVFLTEH